MEHLRTNVTPPKYADAAIKSDTESAFGCLARLTWMLAGNAVLVMLTLAILEKRPWTLTLNDALFWLVVSGIVGVRYVDVMRLGGTTASGAPATPRHVSKYAVRFVALWTLVWTGAQSIYYP